MSIARTPYHNITFSSAKSTFFSRKIKALGRKNQGAIKLFPFGRFLPECAIGSKSNAACFMYRRHGTNSPTSTEETFEATSLYSQWDYHQPLVLPSCLVLEADQYL